MRLIDINRSFSLSAARARKRYETNPRPFSRLARSGKNRIGGGLWSSIFALFSSFWYAITNQRKRDQEQIRKMQKKLYSDRAIANNLEKQITRQAKDYSQRRR